jgi:hypothetical protein
MLDSDLPGRENCSLLYPFSVCTAPFAEISSTNSRLEDKGILFYRDVTTKNKLRGLKKAKGPNVNSALRLIVPSSTNSSTNAV